MQPPPHVSHTFLHRFIIPEKYSQDFSRRLGRVYVTAEWCVLPHGGFEVLFPELLLPCFPLFLGDLSPHVCHEDDVLQRSLLAELSEHLETLDR